jgi:DNA-binding IscR family transcriptional regulator
MRVMDLGKWPPLVGRAFSTSGGDVLAVSPEKVTIQRVVRVLDTHVLFACCLGDRSLYYDFDIHDRIVARKVADILKANIGVALLEVGIVEISED